MCVCVCVVYAPYDHNYSMYMCVCVCVTVYYIMCIIYACVVTDVIEVIVNCTCM